LAQETQATAESPAGQEPGSVATASDRLPAWCPGWARELADLYFSGTTCLFLLHGNVHDLIYCPQGDEEGYCNLSEFLTTQVFGKWDIVLGHDLSRGLRPWAGSDSERLRAMYKHLASRWGEPGIWPREPDKVLLLLEKLIERSLVDNTAERKSIAVLFDYAQYLVPEGDLNTLARGPAGRLVQFLSWAQNPHIKRVNMAFCLVADRLAELNDRLVQSPHVAAIEIPLPDRQERRRFAQWVNGGRDFSQLSDYSPDELADMSNGLNLVNLNVVLSQAARSDRRVDSRRFGGLKKSMIERQCRGLIEFVEPSHTLELIVGHTEAKKRLREDALWISRGQLETAPMGYLICGSVGTLQVRR
jgi:hypothetical protein